MLETTIAGGINPMIKVGDKVNVQLSYGRGRSKKKGMATVFEEHKTFYTMDFGNYKESVSKLDLFKGIVQFEDEQGNPILYQPIPDRKQEIKEALILGHTLNVDENELLRLCNIYGTSLKGAEEIGKLLKLTQKQVLNQIYIKKIKEKIIKGDRSPNTNPFIAKALNEAELLKPDSIPVNDCVLTLDDGTQKHFDEGLLTIPQIYINSIIGLDLSTGPDTHVEKTEVVRHEEMPVRKHIERKHIENEITAKKIAEIYKASEDNLKITSGVVPSRSINYSRLIPKTLDSTSLKNVSYLIEKDSIHIKSPNYQFAIEKSMINDFIQDLSELKALISLT